ncbi:YciI family protein [Aureivirga sp. CE67]|uniref:YciI family protein n=1 Tax=Aureivirga sp. CE67 TaxID=1788983 RepID=UPI0018CA1F0D|nr:YciI family protein [Aureivirga sp. CE67]
MKKFLLLLHEDMEKMRNLSVKEMEELEKSHISWAEKLANSGNLISGDGLQEKGMLISGKDCIVKDGTYLESKELIGGYYLIQAKDLESAVEMAKECPCHIWGGTTEIRPIMNIEEYVQ